MSHIQVQSGALTKATPGLEVLRQSMMESMMNFLKLLVLFAKLTQSAAEKGSQATINAGVAEGKATWLAAMGAFGGAAASLGGMAVGLTGNFTYGREAASFQTKIGNAGQFRGALLEGVKSPNVQVNVQTPAAIIPAPEGTAPTLVAQPVKGAGNSPPVAPNELAKAILKGDSKAFENQALQNPKEATSPLTQEYQDAVNYFNTHPDLAIRPQAIKALDGITRQLEGQRDASQAKARDWMGAMSGSQALSGAIQQSTAAQIQGFQVEKAQENANTQLQQATQTILGASAQSAEKALEASKTDASSILQAVAAASARA